MSVNVENALRPAISLRLANGVVAWFMQQRASLLFLIAFFAAWEIAGHAIGFAYLPPLSKVLIALKKLVVSGVIGKALVTTLWTLAIGLFFSIVLGVVLGAALGLSRNVRIALEPFLDAMMTAPIIAFVPLLILIFGLGVETRVMVVVLFSFFPIAINTQLGLMEQKPALIEMARSFRATPQQIFWRVQLPNAFEYIVSGLRIGIARGIDGIITGEVLIAAIGVGALLTQYGRAFSADRLFAIILVIVTLSLVLTWTSDRLANYMISRGRL